MTLEVLRSRMSMVLSTFRQDGDRVEAPPFVLFGSAVLLLHGLRDAIGDVDLFVRPALYARLLRCGWRERWPDLADPPLLACDCGGVTAHAFARWQTRDPMVDPSWSFRFVEYIDGWPCSPLWVVRAHKAQAIEIARGLCDGDVAGSRWGKHLRDIERIDSHLAGAA